ncbi:hypothetical protein K227x_27670 [Rubripirellula lacrimiformis]|uniref:Glycosyl hydrolase family 76 n=1 Tax=Rubripirellula lacrimiformis TaxID=1930273 RepID=A0A517NB63_9BACT|nr:hypothetical protein [Rubripirellula lacrimiformis]QDT04376.1 hypothetical protein K227x_27670 [Rubripirellula lacrimiformis]
MNFKIWITAILLIAAPLSAGAEGPSPSIQTQIQQAWDVAWSRFYHPDSQTFMDYLSSYEAGKELAHLPSAEEVGRQYPNPCGYGSGMEDGMILGGAMLSAICDQYAVTGDESLREQANQVFSGMHRSATVHGVPGFIARNVCPEDKTSVYINSSRDQVTHFVHGLWKFHHSPLADDATKQQIGSLLADVANRMIDFATPENNYDFCRADGTRCPLGICRMWNVQAHEAARLPMIYAAAWDTTGQERYRKLWRQYITPAVEQSATPSKNSPAYALLQMQASLELLRVLETDESLQIQISKIMDHVASLASNQQKHTMTAIANKGPQEMQMLGPDWRHVEKWLNQTGYPNPQWGPYRQVWHLTREAGETAVIQWMVEAPENQTESVELIRQLITQTDYQHCSSCGVVFHIAAYWKARRNNLLN